MRRLITTLFILTFSFNAFAHFPIFIHDTPFAELNKTVNLFFGDGHPYEHEYEDAPKPEKVMAIPPFGQPENITDQLKQAKHKAGDKEVTVWKLAYQPKLKGDTIIALNAEKVLGRNNQAYQEFTKLLVHVEREDGWDQRTGQPLEIVPLTRPYGHVSGFVFTGRLMKGEEPVANAVVEIEQYLNRQPDLNNLPPDVMITLTTKTDINGYFSYSLPRPGWWMMASYVENVGEVEKDGETYQINGTAQIWLHVEKPFEPLK